jgi:hypothetical protein
MNEDLPMTTKKPAKKTTNRHSGDDVKIATAYLNKARSSKDRGIDFNISFVSFKNMCKAKKCYFTGLTLTADTFTIDRIDSNKPYEVGNVAACHTTFNSLKSMIENPVNELDLAKALRGLQRTSKRIKANSI